MSTPAPGLTDPLRLLAAWHWGGFASIVLVGSVLHFLHDWSGRSPIVAAFSAVNESVWEHLKLGYWSLAWFSVLEYWFVRAVAGNYLAAKGAGILSMHLLILGLHYSYKALLRRHVVALDIAWYFAGAGTCQLLSFRIMTARPWPAAVRLAFAAAFIAHGLALVVFTFRPLRVGLFRDASTGSWGRGRGGELPGAHSAAVPGNEARPPGDRTGEAS